MRVFISYASADRRTAEPIHYALTAAGHETFFDRADIEGSADYNQLLRNQIQQSDAMVFLISPAEGRFFAADAVALFRAASGCLILGYFASAVAAAHRIAIWRGIAASVASFTFFLFAFIVLYLVDAAAGLGIVQRLLRG